MCIHPASLFPALPWLSFVSSGKFHQGRRSQLLCVRENRLLNVFEHGCKTYIRQPTTIPRYMGL